MRPLDRPGTFKARAFEWSVQSLPSGDPLIRVLFKCEIERDGEDWPTMIEPRVVRGDFFLVKKTGTPNEAVVEMLCKHLDWHGTFEELATRQPHDGLVQVEVEANDYKGKTYFQVRWLRGENEDRGGGVSAEKVAELDKRLGGEMKALAKKFAPAADPVAAKKERRGDVASPDNYGDIPFVLLLALPILGVML
ncbi:MAG: hypothetical protein WAT39_01435 [Planctomycetota bacterium]